MKTDAFLFFPFLLFSAKIKSSAAECTSVSESRFNSLLWIDPRSTFVMNIYPRSVAPFQIRSYFRNELRVIGWNCFNTSNEMLDLHSKH